MIPEQENVLIRLHTQADSYDASARPVEYGYQPAGVVAEALRAALRSRPAPPDDLNERHAQALKAAFAAGQASVRVVLRGTVQACSEALDHHPDWCGYRAGSPGHTSFQEARGQLDEARAALAAPAPVAAPAPETPAELLMNRMAGSGFAPPIRFSIGGTGEASSGTPAPDAMPCPECLGMPCAACNGTGRRQEAQP